MTTQPSSSWPMVRLGSIANFRNGLNYTKENFGKGIKVINVKDFGDRLRPALDQLDEIDPTGIVRTESILREGDIVFVRSNGNRDLIGRSMFITGLTEPVSHSAFSIRARLTAQDVVPLFYAYFLRSDAIRRALSSHGGGTNISNLNQEILNELLVPLPPLTVQCRIADILSAYDDLIENNTRRIALLEELAQSLYREWFVHFRFPGHENVPMVESEMGPIPEGWTVKRLGDICTRLAAGGTPSRTQSEYWTKPTISWYKTKELNDKFLLSSEEKISSLGLSKSNAKLFEAGTILMAIYAAPTVGRLGILTEPSSFNQAAIGFVPNAEVVPVPFLFLTLLNLRGEFNRTAQGAAQQNISKEKVVSTRFLLPQHSWISRFDEVIRPIWGILEVLQRKNVNLRQTRDLLLPKLISGEIAISALAGVTG